MNALENIRRGESVTLRVPPSARRKLWHWCLRSSAIGGVNVTELESRHYGVRRRRVMKRMGCARPEIRVFPRWCMQSNRFVAGHSTIFWSYVY